MINADGVGVPVFDTSRAGQLHRKRMQALAEKHLGRDLTRPSKLRMVSLVKLEEACREFAESRKHVTLEMQYLAGLQRIDYVFVYPDEKDIVIAGPAEAFAPDSVGRVVGVTTGRPPIRLDDLMVALRSVRKNGRLGCSIDPDPKRLAEMERFVAQTNRSPATLNVAKGRFAQMANILGMQSVRIWGVPEDSHFAQALVEADYRMKLVSIGREQYRVRGFKSHLDMLGRGGNSMQRWWFAPLYDAFYTSEDGNAYQLEGQRLQLLSQEEVTNGLGERTNAGTTRVTTQRWAKAFTSYFPQLAKQSSSFAELQNLVDLTILAAMIEKRGLRQRVGWDMALFLDEKQAPVTSQRSPKQVPSAFNFKTSGRSLVVGLVGGGVVLSPYDAVKESSFQPDGDRNLDDLRKEHAPGRVVRGGNDGGADASGRTGEIVWWWD